MAEQGDREKEANAISALIEHLETEQDRATTVGREFVARLRSFVPNDVLTGPNPEELRALADQSDALLADLAKSFAEIHERIKSARAGALQIQEQVAAKHGKQQAKYRKLLEEHEAARAAQHQRALLVEEHAAVESLLVAHRGHKSAKVDKERHWRDLVKEVSDLRDERSAAREQAIRTLNEDLSETPVRIRFGKQEDHTDYREILDRALSQATPKFRSRGQLVNRLAADLPRRLVERIRRRADNELVETLGLTPREAERVVHTLANSEALLEIETANLEDSIEIMFNDEGVLKPCKDLSTGQTSSAILPLLLHRSVRPLITDEIESHLDQDTLMETVIKQIGKVHGKRQLIFATHNPNVPVSGDRGDTRVFVMKSNGKQAWVEESGSVQDTKDRILQLLEGGEEAFERRRLEYWPEGGEE